MNATQILLGGAIDYAGLFPPAQLGMEDAVANYAAYRQGGDAWALGRFVVPANRIAEFAAAHAALPGAARTSAWRLSVLAGQHLTGDLAELRDLDAQALRVASLEIRAETAEEIGTLEVTGKEFETYVEIPLSADVSLLVRAIRAAGVRAKMRTGGVTADAFPAPERVVDFIAQCLTSNVPFKATAGLHHPRTGTYRLTYEAGSASGRMFGYLNLVAAIAVLRAGGDLAEAALALTEADPRVLRLEEQALVWRDRVIDSGQLAALRRESLVSFGSCSFREPIDELALATTA